MSTALNCYPFTDFELDLTCLASAFKATLSICDFEAIQRANSAILATAERVGIGLCRVMEFVVNGLMTREKLVRDEKVLKTLCRLNNLFGVSSTIHESFAPIASNLIDVMLRKEVSITCASLICHINLYYHSFRRLYSLN